MMRKKYSELNSPSGDNSSARSAKTELKGARLLCGRAQVEPLVKRSWSRNHSFSRARGKMLDVPV